MKRPRRGLLGLVTGAVALLGVSSNAWAQAYPSRPITIIVPFAAGGPTDTVARIMGDRMKETLGQPVVIENVTGAGSTIGSTRLVQAAADGHTLIVGNWSSHVGAAALYPVKWNVLTDMEPVAHLSASSLMIVGKTALPANNAKELIAWLKANPDKASAAHVGAGSGAHICSLYFQEKTGTRFQFVPYRGGAPVMQDLVAGQIDMFCAEASQTLAACARRKDEGLCGNVEGALGAAARCADHGRGRRDRHAHFLLARDVGAEEHAEGRRRQAQCVGRDRFRRCRRAEAHCRPRPDHPAAPGTDAGGARRLPQIRDRQVVADHQGGEHQGGVTPAGVEEEGA